MGKGYGNERLMAKIAGPFYGFPVEDFARATEIDLLLRRKGQFSIRYQGRHIACSGPEIEQALVEILTPTEHDKPMYTAADLTECLEALCKGEKIQIFGRRSNDGSTGSKF